jgi:uncharacterized protein (TIGR02996 family)
MLRFLTMLGLYVCLADERTTRFEVNKNRVKIGSSNDNDLVLSDGRVILFHCELERKDDGWYLLPRGKVTVRKRVIETVTRVEDGDDIGIGDYVLVLELVPRGADGPSDATEQELLDAIALQRDDESRMVYADWLEGNGDRFRAEFLRLSQRLAGVMPHDLDAWVKSQRDRRRLRELANHIDIAWREQVARGPVDGCRRQRHDRCTMDWGQLVDTTDPSVRHCERCDHDVHYCETIGEAHELHRAGRRVVLDARVVEERMTPIPPPRDDGDSGDDDRWDEPTLPR